MRPTSLIFFAILAVMVLSLINIGIAEYAVIGAISAAVMLIMLVIDNMFNPFKIQWHYIFKGWHYSFQSLLSMIIPFVRMYNSDKKNIIACIRFNRTSWYNQSVVGDHWNKLIGVAAGASGSIIPDNGIIKNGHHHINLFEFEDVKLLNQFKFAQKLQVA